MNKKDIIIEQAAVKATNECKPVHLTVWYVPHPLKLVTFSGGGLDAFSRAQKKNSGQEALIFCLPRANPCLS